MRVIETDEHHHVTPHLALLGDHGCLVAFDSHDDLGAPRRLCAGSFAAFRRLREPGGLTAAFNRGELDIGTWILAAIYAGAFSTVLWINKWATNLPFCMIEAHIGPFAFDTGVELAVVVGPNVPPGWLALWADHVVPAASVSPATRDCFVPFRVVATDAVGAMAQLKTWTRLAGGDGTGLVAQTATSRPRRNLRPSTPATAGTNSVQLLLPPPPPPRQYQISIDLDYLSVRNPATRSVPFHETPAFRRELLALAARVRMENGEAFVAALEALVAGDDTPYDALPKIAAAAHIDTRGSSGARLLSLLASAEVRFNEDVRSLPSLQRILDALLLAGLAAHESTNEELAELETSMAAVIACVSQSGCCEETAVVARSEMYIPRRQLTDLRVLAYRALGVSN